MNFCLVFVLLTKQNTQFIVKSNLAKKFLVDKGIEQSNVHTVGVGIDTEMLARLATALKTIADMGVITINDFDKIRELFGFEKLEGEIVVDEKVDEGIKELIDDDKNS